MKYFLIVLTMVLSLSYSFSALAQTPEDSVKAVINNLFTGMKNADPVLLKTCFSDSAIMQTIGRNKEGKTIVRNDGVQAFIDFVAKEKPGAADERISFETIKIDGPMAIVWAPYNFYYNGAIQPLRCQFFSAREIQWCLEDPVPDRYKKKAGLYSIK